MSAPLSFIDTCPRDLETMPRPDLPLIVTLGVATSTPATRSRGATAGSKPSPAAPPPPGGGPAKTFAFVQTYDHKPKRRLYELLRSQGLADYGERHRNGEAISSATAEATVNHVISRRMVKEQQMRWTPRGAHLLLQIRTRVLNHDLEADFARWYPTSDQPLSLAA